MITLWDKDKAYLKKWLWTYLDENKSIHHRIYAHNKLCEWFDNPIADLDNKKKLEVPGTQKE